VERHASRERLVHPLTMNKSISSRLVEAKTRLMTLGRMSDRPSDWVILLALVGMVATAMYTVQGKGHQAKR
jgi:hypothetical protein